jgi:hypothetical protein
MMSFIQSEKEYYDQLCVVMSLFWIPLRDGVLSEDETEELFGNVPTIWGIHKLFLSALIEAASDWTPEHCVGPTLELYAPLFKIYHGLENNKRSFCFFSDRFVFIQRTLLKWGKEWWR